MPDLITSSDLWSLIVAGGLGVALGARHAFEPDHLAAVSTLVSERPRPRQAALLGALWGLGHTAALALIGVVLVVARAQLAPAFERGLELVVAAMLIVLGTRGIALALRDGRRGAVRAHAHGGHTHVHAGPPVHVHVLTRSLALRPLLIGLVHGAAGSGALAALALAEMPSPATAALYVLLFGLGSMVGMAAISAAAAASMARLPLGATAWRRVRVGTGALAVAIGLAWGALALA
ncbi:MAG: urease accessory protein [Myxococcales bacterium]|nr:urease accessory protein [Myxococcales bacterium]